jgi:hypothetical protein
MAIFNSNVIMLFYHRVNKPSFLSHPNLQPHHGGHRAFRLWDPNIWNKRTSKPHTGELGINSQQKQVFCVTTWWLKLGKHADLTRKTVVFSGSLIGSKQSEWGSKRNWGFHMSDLTNSKKFIKKWCFPWKILHMSCQCQQNLPPGKLT